MPSVERNVTDSPQAATSGGSVSATPVPLGRRARRPRPLHVDEREFLPMAIEILQSPPSPVAVWFIWLICAVFAAAIGWSYFGQIDIYAVARGKIEVTGRSKVVQPLDAGK